MRRYCHNFPLMMNKEGWHLMAKYVGMIATQVEALSPVK